MIRNILLPLDGSEFGEQALGWATLVAKRATASLHLVHVREPLIVPDPLFQETLVDIETPDEARRYLDALLRRVPDLEVRGATRTVVLEGSVGESLCQYALNQQIDLVVMTTHGRGPWAKFWEGSIAETLVRTLPASILLIRADEDGGREEKVQVVTGFRNILMPLPTATIPSDRGGAAWEIARLFGARVTLLHVQATGAPEAIDTGLGQVGVAATSQNLPLPADGRDNHAWEGSRDEAWGRWARLDIRLVKHDSPADAILAEAQRLGCDLIAMETRCRTGLSRLVKGSTADWIVRHASAPVLLHCSRPTG